MSGYQEARQRLARAIAERQAAQAGRDEAQKRLDAAGAELDAATRDLLRFEIDPEACPQQLTGASA